VDCDAIITDRRNIMLGILVADCFPVLCYDAVRGVAAVIHLGWRGAACGLLGRTLDAMQKLFGSVPGDLSVAVGPGINPCNYEVDRPVRDAFRNGVGQWERISEETRLGHWRLDLSKSIQLQLDAAGIQRNQVDWVEECTCCHRETFFSYRRDQGRTGRQMGFVLLR
ncbi:MAG: peptidoglycan editing factor PgeF, partial [Desulfuromonadales bacterium]|nr:peptidoglycan editing factor PgeF [Desulfuromonadales bacterium]